MPPLNKIVLNNLQYYALWVKLTCKKHVRIIYHDYNIIINRVLTK